ncbi:MAG: hypothetical protein GY878_24390 [Fuerstiella sp.]|nr:hypothetical protein [Fuerstiella sp.]
MHRSRLFILLPCVFTLVGHRLATADPDIARESVVKNARNVHLQLLDCDRRTPLANVNIHAYLIAHPSRSDKPITTVRSDSAGWVKLPLAQGVYWLKLDAEETIDCIGLHEPRIGVFGYSHRQDFIRVARRGCEVVFKAIDADTGQGIQGVSFWEENAGLEHWCDTSTPDNVGSKRSSSEEKNRANTAFQTDANGVYSMLRLPQEGWTYHVHVPKGFETVGRDHYDFSILGEGKIEKVFRLRQEK